MQGRGAVRESDDVTGTDVVRNRLLEAGNGGALCDQLRAERLDDCVDILIGDCLAPVREEGLRQETALTSAAISRSSATSSQWSFRSLE